MVPPITRKASTSLYWKAGVIYVLLAVFLCPTVLVAQRSVYKNYTLEDGLPQSQIFDILQDSRGYLWFATYGGGASRFDGHQFVSLTDLSGAPHHRIVYDLFEDSRGALWFATGKGVICYDGDGFELFTVADGLTDDRVRYIEEDDDGDLWFATANGVSRYNGRHFEAYTMLDGLPDTSVEIIVKDNAGTLWFGTQAGISRYDGEMRLLEELGPISVNDILLDQDNILWVGSDDGLIRYDGTTIKTYTTAEGLPDIIVHSLHEDEDRQLWIGTQRGMATYFNGSISRVESRLFDADPVWEVTSDEEGNIWIGTSGKGVFLNIPSPFFHLTPEDGLADAIVWNFVEDDEGTLWVGTMNGLNRYQNGILSTFTTADGLVANEIRSVLVDKSGLLWLGTTKGIQTFDGENFSVPAPFENLREKVRSIYEVDDGIWFATDLGAIFYDGTTVKITPNNVLGARPNGMVQGPDGNMWFATGEGITKYNGVNFKEYEASDGLAHPVSLSINVGPEGNIWVGTYGGITRVKPAKGGRSAQFDTITRSEGMPDDVIYFVLFDDQEFLWTCTNSGLYRLDIPTYFETGEKLIKSYDRSNGFIGQECNTQAGYKDSKGDLWFGTVKGATRYSRHFDYVNDSSLPIHITGLNLFYEKPAWNDLADSLTTWTGMPNDLVLSHDQNHLTFEYSGPGFTAPEKIRFKYKLDGFDEEWSPPVARREATYANLPPGAYVFSVLVSNGEGVWASTPASFAFEITMPFWQKPWFFLTCILSVLLSIFVFIRLRTRSFEQHQKVLEETVALRTNDLLKTNSELEATNNELVKAREAALEAARTKSEFLANMSHEIRTPLNGIIGFTSLLLDSEQEPEEQEYLEIIRASGENLLTIINDILDFSKIEADKVKLEKQSFFIHACVEEALDLLIAPAAKKDLELTHYIDEAVPGVIVGDVTRLRQIIVNLLSNAVKFSEKGEISVIATWEQHSERTRSKLLHIAVSDEGIGIPADRIGSLFESFEQVDASTTRKFGGTGLGLSISHRLCELMGGKMWVESTPGEGSTFHFTIETKAARRELFSEQGEGASSSLAGKRIIVIDDHETNRRMLKKNLRAWGMEVTMVSSSSDALYSLYQDHAYDLILIDMDMPEMDGQELTLALCKHPEIEKIPRLIMSVLGHHLPNASKTLWAGSVNKPIKQAPLFNALMGILNVEKTAYQRESVVTIDTSFAQHHPLQLLIAEDNGVNQKVLGRILGRLGYRVDIANNGLEVLKALEMRSYDIVLMDLHMPEMDGLEATRKILEKWDTPHRPVIVAMTAAVLEEDRERCREAGMQAFLGKPVKVEKLMETLSEIAQQRAANSISGAA